MFSLGGVECGVDDFWMGSFSFALDLVDVADGFSALGMFCSFLSVKCWLDCSSYCFDSFSLFVLIFVTFHQIFPFV